MATKATVHPCMPEAQYHALPYYLGSTTLRDISQHGALMADRRRRAGVTPNDAMIFGTIVHALSLPQDQGGERLDWDPAAVEAELMRLGGCERYAVGPEARRNSKAWTEWAAQQDEGVALLKPSDIAATRDTARRALDCAHALQRCEPAADLLWDAVCERSILWTDEQTGLECKARIDALTSNRSALVDLKVTTSADPAGFIGGRGIVWTRRYMLQAAYYLDAAILAGEADHRTRCLYVAVHPEAPHPVGVYELPPEAIEIGRSMYRRALNEWRSYLDQGGEAAALRAGWVRTAQIPGWVRNL